MTGRVHDLISNPAETAKLSEVIAEGTYYGMQTFDQALLTLYQDGQDLDGRSAQGSHPSARLQAAGRGRGTALDVGRADLLLGPLRHRGAARARRGRGACNGRCPQRGASLQFVKPLVSSLVTCVASSRRLRRARPAVTMGSNDTCPVCHTAEIISGKWTLLVIRDLAEGAAASASLSARSARNQPAHALAEVAGPRGGGDRRAQDLPRGPAPGRVPPHDQGARAGPADRPDARLRSRVAHERQRRVAGTGTPPARPLV